MPNSPIEPAARLWLEQNGLLRPDGRALHRYRLTREQYDSLRARLTRWIKHFRVDPGSLHLAGAFCLFVAEWYKREFREGQWSWDGPCAAIGLSKDQFLLQQLTRLGLLAYWRQPLLQSHWATEYLFSLVLQGGIPTAFAVSERGWLSGYVRQVLREVESDPRPDAARADLHAEHHAFRIPESFRKPPLLRLVAELAVRLAALRAEATGRPDNVDLVAWLDARRPGWRDELPIEVADVAVKALIEGLVRERGGPAGATLRVERMLLPGSDGHRQFGLHLELDGELDPESVLPGIVHQLKGHRVRLMPAGTLAERLHGCLAILERPDEGERAWPSRANLAPAQRLVAPFSLEADVEAVLRIEGIDTDRFSLPGGQRPWSDVLAFRLRDGQSPEEALPLAAAGSLRIRDERLCLVVFRTARGGVRSLEGSLERIGTACDGDIYVMAGRVEVDLGEGLLARFTTGATEDAVARLEAVGPRPVDIWSDVPLFRGWPSFVQISAGGLISPRSDKWLIWRSPGLGQPWRPLDRAHPPLGLVEVATIDEDGALQARLRLGLLPSDARVNRVAARADRGAVELVGFDEVDLRVSETEGGHVSIMEERDGDRRRIEIDGDRALCRETEVAFRWRGAQELRAKVPISGAQVAFHDAAGRRLRSLEREALARLRGATLETILPATLDLALVEPGQGVSRIGFRRQVEGTIPLSMLRSEIETLLSLSTELDAEVRIEATAGGACAILIVRRFAIEIETAPFRIARRGLDRLPPDTGIVVVGRPFADLCAPETRLAEVAAAEAELPQIDITDGDGPWLVYVRAGEETLSRPLLLTRSLAPEREATLRRLALALVAPAALRASAIEAALTDLATGADPTVGEDLTALVRTYARVIPLQSLDVLVRLSETSIAAVALVWSAHDEDLPLLLDLERELPFSWATTPIAAWMGTARKWLETQEATFRALSLNPTYAADAVRRRLGQIRTLAPQLAAHVAFAAQGCGLTVDGDWGPLLRAEPVQLERMASTVLRGIAGECVKRNGERRKPPMGLRFRSSGSLPEEILGFDQEFHELLDAPFVAAELALGRRPPSQEVERGLRLCRLYDPVYLDEAFPWALASLKEAHAAPAQRAFRQ